MAALYGKASLGFGESTRPTGNDVNFCDSEVIGVLRRFSRSDNRGIDDVSIGRLPLSRPCVSQVSYRNFLSK